jgi:poly-gamma-glutamate synthesis protein (capsule biosynthesis protein)
MKPDKKIVLIVGSAFLAVILFLLALIIVKPKKSTLLKIQPKEVTILLTGDMMIGRSVMIKSFSLKDYAYPFRKVGETLKTADIVFGNLENPLVSGCPISNEGFKLCADPKMIEGLIFAGVDVVTLANNHTTNYGQKGLEETINILNQNGIKTVGINNLVIEEKGGKKFGFLGFDFTLRKPTDSDLQLVTDSDPKADVLIVGIHWGEEYKALANSFQQSVAKKIVDAGADVIVGHHPHWVQNSEYINEKPIYYSLGNFIFDQMWSEETKKGLAIRLTFKDGVLVNEEQLPVYISSLGQPEFITN